MVNSFKKSIQFLAILIFLILNYSVLFAVHWSADTPITYGETLTDNQLKQIVYDFEQNDNIEITLINYDEIFNVYELSNSTFDWYIDSINYNVVLYYKRYSLMNNISSVNININQAYNLALNYINSKNINLLNYNITPVIYSEYDNHYIFKWVKDLGYNIISENSIYIYVNKFSGNIDKYNHLVSFPDPIINNPPTITDQIVKNVLYNNLSINENEIVSISPVKVEEGNIVKEVLCSDDYLYFIDAYNYNIVDWDCPLGNNKNKKINIGKATVFDKIKREPEIKQIDNSKINAFLFDTENSKDVKYTDISTVYEMDKEDKGIARMEINGNKFIFRNGSYWCFINNKTYNMGGNCIIKDGKLQLPEDFYKKVQTKDYNFSRRVKNN